MTDTPHVRAVMHLLMRHSWMPNGMTRPGTYETQPGHWVKTWPKPLYRWLQWSCTIGERTTNFHHAAPEKAPQGFETFFQAKTTDVAGIEEICKKIRAQSERF